MFILHKHERNSPKRANCMARKQTLKAILNMKKKSIEYKRGKRIRRRNIIIIYISLNFCELRGNQSISNSFEQLLVCTTTQTIISLQWFACTGTQTCTRTRRYVRLNCFDNKFTLPKEHVQAIKHTSANILNDVWNYLHISFRKFRETTGFRMN